MAKNKKTKTKKPVTDPAILMIMSCLPKEGEKLQNVVFDFLVGTMNMLLETKGRGSIRVDTDDVWYDTCTEEFNFKFTYSVDNYAPETHCDVEVRISVDEKGACMHTYAVTPMAFSNDSVPLTTFDGFDKQLERACVQAVAASLKGTAKAAKDAIDILEQRAANL